MSALLGYDYECTKEQCKVYAGIGRPLVQNGTMQNFIRLGSWSEKSRDYVLFQGVKCFYVYF